MNRLDLTLLADFAQQLKPDSLNLLDAGKLDQSQTSWQSTP
jgi:hypothetical protein